MPRAYVPIKGDMVELKSLERTLGYVTSILSKRSVTVAWPGSLRLGTDPEKSTRARERVQDLQLLYRPSKRWAMSRPMKQVKQPKKFRVNSPAI